MKKLCILLFVFLFIFNFSLLIRATNTPFANENQIQIQTGEKASSYPRSSIFYNQMKDMQRMQDEMKNDIKEMLSDPKMQKPLINKNEFAKFRQIARNYPQIKYSTDKDNYIAEIIMPGVDKKDIKLQLNDKILKVSTTNENSTQKIDKNTQSFANQMKNFSQFITVPNDVNTSKINSEYKNGILTIKLPKLKTDQSLESRSIPVN